MHGHAGTPRPDPLSPQTCPHPNPALLAPPGPLPLRVAPDPLPQTLRPQGLPLRPATTGGPPARAPFSPALPLPGAPRTPKFPPPLLPAPKSPSP